MAGGILAIDTCLAACSAGVVTPDGGAFAQTERIGTGHAERIAPMVAAVLAAAGTAARDLGRIACTVGPGSFMGARVGVSLAKGLALPAGLPLLPITTTKAIALGAPRPCTVLIDARRGQAYVQRFADGPSAVTLRPYREAAATIEPGDAVRGVGLAAVLGEGAPPDVLAQGDAFPDPEAMARWAANATPGPLRPFYLRAPDAKPPGRAPL